MTNRISNRWPVYIAVSLLLIITAVFVLEFITSSQGNTSEQAQGTEFNADQVATLAENGDAQRGATLVEQFGCIVCHRLGAANQNIAPPFVGISERAGTREPALSAQVYIYESIINPAAFIVDGYNPVMPQNYLERLTETDLGDIIAYLLTPDAN